ncbi:hypothetical protein FHU10_1212 [Serratia fonticola]|jgi:hypothetical protein|uniref:Uncharacterized protein n=1 Tax=Serratia fonticola TaxID=47917 RepID=A0A559T2C1_SERFO|nr:hypothetical protein [Serratia fonticola]TQI78747.1 hypothetical protein FHU09_1239 [Serratia fonticola]TQI99231.1 hypothetical protein FHU11_4813 [Serratia fonticola]TVZ68756.1 hypothetical protein FHU10_1212 [Serratia fonticola]
MRELDISTDKAISSSTDQIDCVAGGGLLTDLIKNVADVILDVKSALDVEISAVKDIVDAVL